jgi:two-component system, OmpR family, sensor histidine kinase KdpD
MTRGQLRVYLGAAPGVGKTFAMLCEARRRAERGADVVVGLVETHGRARTAELLAGLEVLPRRRVTYRDASFDELDLDAVIARHPDVVLIDELAHTNIPGSAHAKRWEDVEAILHAGIDVITTINIQHLESLNDVVEAITGVKQQETVPDDVVRRADQVELVDMTAEALRRRMAHGNIYPPDRIDAALGRYFRVGNLTALRELALLWLADKIDDQLDRYRAEHGIEGTWETRERVVVAVTGGPESDTLIRRAARIAERARGADLLAVHVARDDGLSGATAVNATQRELVESLGGTYHRVLGDDIPRALLDFARGVNATQLVLGVSSRGRLARILSPGVGATTTALSGPIDVHMVSHDAAARSAVRAIARTSHHRGPALSAQRRVAGFLLTLLGLPALTLMLSQVRGTLSLPSDIMLFLVLVVGVALLGGLWPALTAALVGSALLNYYFTPPIHKFTIADGENLLALVAYVVVAAAVSAVVDLAARRTREATQAGADAAVLSSLATAVLSGDRALVALLERLRATYRLDSVTLLEHRPDVATNTPWRRDPSAWRVAASVGGEPCLTPHDGDAEVPVAEDLLLVLRGPDLPATSRRVLGAFAAQAALALRQQRLTEAAEATEPLLQGDRMRRALLSAVSHDLRTPLASAKAAVESLHSSDIAWSADERAQLLSTAKESLDRLDALVVNLLHMSRLQAGALGIAPLPLAIEDVVPRALDELGPAGLAVKINVPPDLPEVLADPGLLERVLVNLIANALRHNPTGQNVLVNASSLGDLVEIRIVDRGPGIPPDDRERVFLPFQRLGDRDNTTGVGLGLALARGLTEAMGGALVPDDTPGGGLTMIVTLPAAAQAAESRAHEEADAP